MTASVPACVPARVHERAEDGLRMCGCVVECPWLARPALLNIACLTPCVAHSLAQVIPRTPTSRTSRDRRAGASMT
eukprot:15172801-Alexandrium_andersonii.AAC.1